jgi:2-phospho-L-lactate guanylyltransferase
MLEDSLIGELRWHALVPAKALHNSKTRLDRTGLAAAFLSDTILAIIGSTRVTRVTVITPDSEVVTLGKSLGADAFLEENSTGLLSALDLGMQSVSPSNGILIVLGDLPCLTIQDVDSFLTNAARHQSSFMCDSEGTGSTMWARVPGSNTKPRFGVRSRAAHRENGAVEISGSPGAHRDVDTPTGLWDAIRIGVGPHTLKALSEPTMRIATISGLDPLLAVDESGRQSSYPDYTLIGLIDPRIGQRIRIDVESKRIML